jgi:hypothetical protein
MMDISVVQAFLGGEFYLAAVFDAFSRVPLALSTYEQKPGACAMARLLRTAARNFASPKYLITDQGPVLRKARARAAPWAYGDLGTRPRIPRFLRGSLGGMGSSLKNENHPPPPRLILAFRTGETRCRQGARGGPGLRLLWAAT